MNKEMENILSKKINIDTIKEIFDELNNIELLMPFNEDKIIYIETEEMKKYIPLFTNETQINENIKYTRLDRVRLDIVIKDIYNKSDYYAITINPYTNDFIMNRKMIDIYTTIVGKEL